MLVIVFTVSWVAHPPDTLVSGTVIFGIVFYIPWVACDVSGTIKFVYSTLPIIVGLPVLAVGLVITVIALDWITYYPEEASLLLHSFQIRIDPKYYFIRDLYII